MHGQVVIGTAVPASPGAGNGKWVRQVTKGPISAGRHCRSSSGSGSGASREEGAGRGNCLSRDAALGDLFGGVRKRSGTQERFSQEGPWNIGRFWPGTSVLSAGPDGSKQQRTFGPRTGVGKSGSSHEGVVRWDATPELVSQDRERVFGAFGLPGPGYEHRHILRSAQWGLAAMPAPISYERGARQSLQQCRPPFPFGARRAAEPAAVPAPISFGRGARRGLRQCRSHFFWATRAAEPGAVPAPISFGRGARRWARQTLAAMPAPISFGRGARGGVVPRGPILF